MGNKFKGLSREFLKNIQKHTDEDLVKIAKDTGLFLQKNLMGYKEAAKRAPIPHSNTEMNTRHAIKKNIARQANIENSKVPEDVIDKIITKKHRREKARESAIKDTYFIKDSDPLAENFEKNYHTSKEDRRSFADKLKEHLKSKKSENSPSYDYVTNSLSETGAISGMFKYTRINTPGTFKEYANQIRKAREMYKAYSSEVARRKIKIPE